MPGDSGTARSGPGTRRSEPGERADVEGNVPASVSSDGRTATANVDVLRFEQGDFLNYLPDHGDGTFGWRVTARIALPETFISRLESLKATVDVTSNAVSFSRSMARYEVWGARRFVNVQVEGKDGRLAQAGAKAIFRWSVR